MRAGRAGAVIARFHDLDSRQVRTLLCDADGNLFPSEEPAFAASAVVVNRLLRRLGTSTRYDSEQLRAATTGRNFRATAAELAAAAGRPLGPQELERWIGEESRRVTAHLRRTLTPDAEVSDSLSRLSEHFDLAVVSSSALSRLDACFSVTGLDDLFPAARRFSAEDSLARPASKPDPAVYRCAMERLGLADGGGLAIEDSTAGVRSAVAAGLPAIGNVCFVAQAEREARVAELADAGAYAVVASWRGVEALLGVGAAVARAA